MEKLLQSDFRSPVLREPRWGPRQQGEPPGAAGPPTAWRGNTVHNLQSKALAVGNNKVGEVTLQRLEEPEDSIRTCLRI